LEVLKLVEDHNEWPWNLRLCDVKQGTLGLLVFGHPAADHHKTHCLPGLNFGLDGTGDDVFEELKESLSG
jgi:hypothetical protein